MGQGKRTDPQAAVQQGSERAHAEILAGRERVLHELQVCGGGLVVDAQAIGHPELSTEFIPRLRVAAVEAVEELYRTYGRVHGVAEAIRELTRSAAPARTSASTAPTAPPSAPTNAPLALSDDAKRVIKSRLFIARRAGGVTYDAERAKIRAEFPGMTDGTLRALLATATRQKNGEAQEHAGGDAPAPKRRSHAAARQDHALTVTHRDDIMLEMLRAGATRDAKVVARVSRELAEKYERSKEEICAVADSALHNGLKACAVEILSRIAEQRDRMRLAKELIAIAKKRKEEFPGLADLLHAALALRSTTFRGS